MITVMVEYKNGKVEKFEAHSYEEADKLVESIEKKLGYLPYISLESEDGTFEEI